MDVDLTVEVENTEIVEVSEVRQQFEAVELVSGPQGIPGTKGDRGNDGFGTLSYIHNQTVESTEWLIDHNLGTYPSVTTVDFEGNEFEGAVRYDESGNTLMVTFNVAVRGKAFLN